MSSGTDDYQKKVKRGIRASLNAVIPGMGISSNALRLISLCLSRLDSQMVDECKKHFARRKNPARMPISEARKAVAKILTRELLPLAEAAANKCIMRYNAGLIQYYPPTKKKRSRPLKTTSKLILPEFTKCVPEISHMVHEDISMKNEAKTMVGVILQRVVVTLMEKMLQASTTDRITSADVIRAVNISMTGSVAKHAISEGVRTCLLLSNDLHQYKTEDFEKRRRNNAKTRRMSRRK